MRFTSIASGSSGNCTYIGSETTHILIDAGVSKKRIEEGLNGLDLTLSDIDAIFVTHEHSDHISALHTILKKFDIPIYATGGTIQGIKASDKKCEMTDSRFIKVNADEEVSVGDMRINPMTISHDANEPCGYTIFVGPRKIGVATDLGCYDDYIVNRLSDCDALLLEANHDIRMLQLGPYSYSLKQRILSDNGHLSNEASGRFISKLLNDDIKGIMLGHLSDKNNLPDLAYEAVKVEITMSDTKYDGLDFPIYVAKRSELSKIIDL